MPTVTVHLPAHTYPVHIAAGALDSLGAWVQAAAPHRKALLLADEAVLDTHGRRARASLEQAGYQLLCRGVPAGEDHKNLDTVRSLYDACVGHRMERGSPVIALGGGVIGDTVGFVAATYLRGVPFIQCPTTLLAMVDASVGGKVGVNLPQGKNLVGAFHQPLLVVADIDTLATLPVRQLRCGLAECVKHAVIRDAALFAWIADHAPAVLRLDRAALVELVTRNVAIKAAVVEADEREMGERAHLNFGHTFAHAIEAADFASPADAYLHGEAVALGMVAAARLAVDARRCPPDVLDRLVNLLTAIGLPTHSQRLPPAAQLLDLMRVDKKVASARLRLVLPDRLGAVAMTADVPEEAILKAWHALGAR